MPAVRRQLSLFLSGPERALVDAVRRQFDPHQHSIIPAHITLCRDEETDMLVRAGLPLRVPGPVDVQLALGPPLRRSDGCVLLPVQGSTMSFDTLRQQLLGTQCGTLVPHITLMHPRNVASTEDDLARIRALPLPVALRLTELLLIEQRDGAAWHILQRI